MSAFIVTRKAWDTIGPRQKSHCPYLLRVAKTIGCSQCGHELGHTSAVSSLTISPDHQAQSLPCHTNALHFSDFANAQCGTQPILYDFQKHLNVPTIPTAKDALYLWRHNLFATNRSC